MERRDYRIGTGALAALGAVVVYTVATQVFPYHSLNHDEAVYLQQAAMLLEGQLALHPPVEGAFRPWFFVADGDRLYPKYAPVPAAMFALGRLAGGYRLALAAIAAANLTLVVAVVREVFDRPTGLVAGAFVLASPLFLVDSSVFLPYAPTTLLNLLFAYGYLRADRTGDERWAALAGAAVGLAFFARPYTAVLFALPFVGHALWTARTWRADGRDAVRRQAIVAALGTLGVAVTLAYNAIMTGSPWLFPYEAFAPHDGLGFGHRQILGHEMHYTPELALRANGTVVGLLFTEWVAGGLLGTLLAAVGVARAVGVDRSPRGATLAGLFGSVVAGNVLFWGNVNILGGLDRAGDGLVAAFGPYYHFDLLLPTAAFAAAGPLWAARWLHRVLHRGLDGRSAGRLEGRLDGRLVGWLDEGLDRRLANATLVAVLVATAGVAGTVTASDIDARLDENMVATEAYEAAYAPFEGGPPKHSVVLLPDPYGDWLNHPFQALRNDPGFDGRAVYALDEYAFAVADAYPDRALYRYAYRGSWAPYAGSPDAARLQRVRDVSGSQVRLETTVGIPDGAIGVTARVSTDHGRVYHVAANASNAADAPDRLDLDLVIANGTVRVGGDLDPVNGSTLAVDGRDVVRVTVFVDYPAGGGFAYRFELPVDVDGDRVRALTPRVERCRNVRACGGAAAHIPGTGPEGVLVRTELSASDDAERRAPDRVARSVDARLRAHREVNRWS